MLSNISFKKPLFLVSIIGIVISFILLFFPPLDLFGQISDTKPVSFILSLEPTVHQTLQNLIHSADQNISLGEQVKSKTGMRLRIPTINVNATIEPAGMTQNGEMGVPKGPNNVTWFKLGPRPGESGSAVIAGHYGRWKTGEGSVFDTLHTLRKGDKIYVEDEKGITTTFIVREKRNYDPNANASEIFTSKDGKSHLNLITCEGVWNKSSKSYTKRLVVFTDKEEI